MTRMEFKQALNNYKSLSDIIKQITKFNFKDYDYENFYISNGHIFVNLWTGEDGPYNEVHKIEDVTKLVIADLMPDDFIF